MQIEGVGIETFFGHNHDVQGGNGRRSDQPHTFAQYALDPIANHGVPDFFADGQAQTPRGVRLRTRQDKQKENFPVIPAARLKAGREFLLSPEPARRREI